MDLNCDLGEIQGSNDKKIMPWITTANIACGAHAGDPASIEKTIQLALKYGVVIGAHPGYPDRENFGRKEMKLTNEELRSTIINQVGLVKSKVEAAGGKLNHVKLHGALYNVAAINPDIAEVIINTVYEIDNSLIMYGLANSEMKTAADKAGVTFASEVFADRAYNNDGTLVSRNQTGAVLHDTTFVIRRAIRMINEGCVDTISGNTIPVQADTICIHGDNEMAAEFAKKLAKEFKIIGIDLKPFSRI